MATNHVLNSQNIRRAVIGIILFTGLIFLAFNIIQNRAAAEYSKLDLNLRLEATKCASNAGCRSPARLIKMAEVLSAGEVADAKIAKTLVEKALLSDDLQPGAWALHAYLETKLNGEFNTAASSSLKKSIQTCPLCDNQALLRWRLTFVLQNWSDVAEDLRNDVFIGGDLLRWWYLDYEFLDGLANFALERNIPYHEYRARVDTPYRPEEIQIPS